MKSTRSVTAAARAKRGSRLIPDQHLPLRQRFAHAGVTRQARS